MSDITATEASRNFSDLLDAVEHRGESFTILRRGKVVAHLRPVPKANGWRVLEILRDAKLDPSWGHEIAETRKLLYLEDRWPDD
ncbi:MAG TPA: type II toxin-antitoxin system prevent-host-death family antitoxin [Acidimicrobiia bacterium]|nr:type II toxin-antitoxin system prevent-host-death family antitoxin [Acidimicrobiia bacterium]